MELPACVISESEELIAGGADSGRPILAPPAVDKSSFFSSEDVCQQSANTAFRWELPVANVCLDPSS